MRVVSGRGYDKLFNESMIVCGECALQRCGLTSHLTNQIQAFTNDPTIHNCENMYIKYYYTPIVDFSDCVLSVENSLIYEPKKERALLEYIKNIDYFNEGILIEGLKDYIRYTTDYRDRLYEFSCKYEVSEDTINYWINEALEDEDD